MEYSAATASLSIGSVLFLVPHLLIGLVLLIVGLLGRCIMRGGTGKICLVFQIPIGALFFGIACWGLVEGTMDTLRCREAEAKGDFESVSGKVHVIERFPKPGASYLRFAVGDREFKTRTAAGSCDCGYIIPAGLPMRIAEGMEVEVKVHKGAIIALKVTRAG